MTFLKHHACYYTSVTSSLPPPTFYNLRRMASFFRRFATTASAGKNMYFVLAAGSVFPLYTILNDTSSSPSLPSRSNVFVSAKKKLLYRHVFDEPHHPLLSSILLSMPSLLVVLFLNFSTTRFLERHVISVNSPLASMDLGIKGANSIE